MPRIALTWIFLLAGTAVSAQDTQDVPGPDAPPYKCLFNHELLIVSHQKENSPAYIASFIEKLEPTDVDAVMCCPTMWRANFFPSKVDPTWQEYEPGQPVSKFKSYDYAMRYLHAGGDPVAETLAACRRHGKAFFISYRMNDHHYTDDVDWPTHNRFWRDHPEYWLGDTDDSPYGLRNDRVRLNDYLLRPVRDYYFSIIEELCTDYDVDGVELDFQRFPRFFHEDEVSQGTPIMTEFVARIRRMLDRMGSERGKRLYLCVRIPHTLADCDRVGLDIATWDQRKLVDMVNVSSYYHHTIELGIEEIRARAPNAKIYGEMNYITYQNSKVSKFARRYTTREIYHASAFNLLHRGVDGLSLFNFDYVPSQSRLPMTETLLKITDLDYLAEQPKDYAVYRGFGTFPAKNEQTVALIIPDKAPKSRFARSLLRVETQKECTDLRLGVWLNGTRLEECPHDGVELFPPVAQNEAYAAREAVRFFTVPLDLLNAGENRIRLENLSPETGSCTFFSLELALYPPDAP